MRSSFAIAGRSVGQGQPCYVIAEAGVNHNCDLKLGKLLVDGATLLVEWAERGGARLPPPDLSLDFRYQGVDARQIHLVANTNVGKQLAIAVESSSDHG